jgi:Brix domain
MNSKRRKVVSSEAKSSVVDEARLSVQAADMNECKLIVNDDCDEDFEKADVDNPGAFISDGRYRNKQRCLVLCSRGVTARYRHLLEDLRTLIPHHKKESKLDAGNESTGKAVADICEMRGCNTVLFLECRKHQDAYLWMGRTGGQSVGPSVRFHVTNIHTMDELRLTGNCMKHSRPILSFDSNFGKLDHLKLLKELFVDIFGTPRGHPKSKPFVDRVMAFYFADNRVRTRCNSKGYFVPSMITPMMSVCRT